MAGLTPTGFVAKTFDEIRAGFEAKQRATIDQNIDTTEFSLIGNLNGIMATEIAALWELAEEVHDAFDPDKAVGESQDTLYSLTGTLRRAAQNSSVQATVNLKAGANIAKGAAQASVSGNPTAKFVNDEPMVNATGAPANVSVRFVATKTGAIAANAGTLTVIDTPLAAWNSITNPLDATLGSEIELDSLYRLRRLQEIAQQGGGTVPGIKADLMALPTVRAAAVLENDTDFNLGALPPKSVEAVVRSDIGANDDQAIALSLWRNKTGGTRLFGTQSVVITDSQGFSRTVFFSRPAERQIYILLRLKTDPILYVGDIMAKTIVVDALEDPTSSSYHDVGTDVFAARVVIEAMKVTGVLNADARVSFDPAATWATALSALDIDQREIAVFDTSRCTISAFP